MRRGPLAHLHWPLAAALILAGSQAAHEAAYRIVAPDAGKRAEVLAASGHGYLALAPLAFGVLIALAAASLAGQALLACRGTLSARVAAAPFAFLPALAFAVQEHLERLLHSGELPVAAALEPTFLLGLALQLPFGLAAFLLTRLLLGLSTAAGIALARAPRRVRRPAPDAPLPGDRAFRRVRPFRALRPARGPPALVTR